MRVLTFVKREGVRVKWYRHDPTRCLEGMIGLTSKNAAPIITLIDLLYARAPHGYRDRRAWSLQSIASSSTGLAAAQGEPRLHKGKVH